MKKLKVSLAALTLIVAIAGTSTAHATKAQDDVPPCEEADPFFIECTNHTNIVCCDEGGGIIRTTKPIIEGLY